VLGIGCAALPWPLGVLASWVPGGVQARGVQGRVGGPRRGVLPEVCEASVGGASSGAFLS